MFVRRRESFRLIKNISFDHFNRRLSHDDRTLCTEHIENKLGSPEKLSENAYAADDLPQFPLSLSEAAALFNNSRAAISLFRDLVVYYLVHCAFLENKENEKAVTDWELFRYFERI